MAYLKHPDDDGDLSVFTSGDEVLIACSGGHYWVLNAEMKQAPESIRTEPKPGGPQLGGRGAGGQNELARFGSLAVKAMRRD